MKLFRNVLTFIIITASIPLSAASRKSVVHQKQTPKPAQLCRAQNLSGAGPVWKNATPPQSTHQYSESMQRVVRPEAVVVTTAAQHELQVDDVQFAENGTIFFIRGKLGSAAELKSVTGATITTQSAGQSTTKQDTQLAHDWLNTFSTAMKIKQAADELHLSRSHADALGKRHLRFQQYYQDIPVWANEVYVHIDTDNQVYAVNGRYAPTPVSIDKQTATISSTQAIQKSRAYLAELNLLRDIPAEMAHLLRFSEPTSTEAIWIDKEGTPHLVWQVDIYANVIEWFTLMVDAVSGDVLQKYSNTMSEGSTNASGVDLSGMTRSFRAYEENGTYFMLSDLNELSGGSANLPNNPSGGLWVIDLQNNDPSESSQFYHVTSSSATSWNDRSAVSAIYNFDIVYNYFKNTHGRRGIDNNASTIVTVVNVTQNGQAMDNAYWNGSAMFWGNGDQYFSPLAGALDVAAHELTHGITEYTANLIYQDQPGALNESMSDFFGAMVDRDDWLMGEDIMLPGTGSALRDISNPHNPNVLSQLPQTMDEYVYTSEDFGGVHINCGIPLYAAYLIATDIGRDKTEKIYYRALTTYLTRQSQFIDARKAVEQSTIDLYGSGSELNTVKTAFDAVKITDTGSSEPTPRGAGENEVAPTTGGTQWIAFVRDDQKIGLYNVNEGAEYYYDIRVKSRGNNWTQFSTTADGRYLYFVNENGVFTRADMTTTNTETFDNIYIYSPGDLWNSAISRDGQYVAFTSIYEDDNNIYLYIGGKLYYISLDLPSTQEGISSSTIQYPDVLNWSPNAKYPKLAFDAYNQITLPSGQIKDWWSMGEIDFTGDELQVYSLLPAQPDGISVGNVQYSSTDPDRIAYSYIEEAANYWDIKIDNFAETDQNRLLKFQNRDVERPSFSPDDQMLVVNRFTDDALLILDINAPNYYQLNLSTGGRYPEWFVVGGSYDLAVESSPTEQLLEFTLEANYPNPFNAGTMINFTLSQASHIHVAIYDLRGRLVQTLVDNVKTAGRHIAHWQGTDATGQTLASGIYFCRITAENGLSASQKMLMVK